MNVELVDTTQREQQTRSTIDWAVWKKLWGYTRPYRSTVVGLGALAVGIAVLETLYPLLTRHVVDETAARGRDAPIITYALVYLALTAVFSLCVFGFINFAAKIKSHVSHDIRRDGFENLQRLSFSFYDRSSVGWLMSRMTSDCERLSNILAWGVVDLIWGTTLMVGIATVMLILNIKLALAVLAIVPVLAVVSRYFQKRILRSARLVRKTNSRLTAAYNEGLMGNRTSKVFGREEENLSDFRELSTKMSVVSVRNALYSALFLPVVLTLGSVATGVALALGGYDVVLGSISVGTLFAFMIYARHFFEPIQEMAYWFAELQMAQASAERIIGLIEEKPEVANSAAVLAKIETEHRRRTSAAGSASAHGANGAGNVAKTASSGLAIDGMAEQIDLIEFVDVGFAYVESSPVLVDFNLRVKAGERIALVGATGGGKSTIISLLCRFYEPANGEIRFNGVDYRERSLSWLQSNLGIVLQSPHLFSGTVAENIRYGRLEATDEEVRQAARLAAADDLIDNFPRGFDTEVGEGGDLLSTGEKQLVSIARAILARPQILVMDEATSSVDTETERLIQRGLENMLSGRTSFVVAHRLSTVRNADRILVIEDGRMAETGTHDELLARRGHYFNLYVQQSADLGGRI